MSNVKYHEIGRPDAGRGFFLHILERSWEEADAQCCPDHLDFQTATSGWERGRSLWQRGLVSLFFLESGVSVEPGLVPSSCPVGARNSALLMCSVLCF